MGLGYLPSYPFVPTEVCQMKDLLIGLNRVEFCHQPTALEAMPRLSQALGGLVLWI